MKAPKKFLILILTVTNIFSAGFDCQKAISLTEKMICKEPEISELDSKFSKYYSAIQSKISSEEKKSLIAEQREWLRERDSDCQIDKECLKDKYTTRLGLLQTKYGNHFFDSPTDDEVKQICTMIAETPIFLKDKWIEGDIFDINNDGINETIISRYSGTMQNPYIEYTLANGNNTWTNQVNFEWTDYWNEHIDHFIFNGKIYTYNSNTFNEQNVPVHLSIVTPNNSEYTLCSFDNKMLNKLIPNPQINNAQEICQAVENKDLEKIKYIDFNLKPIMSIPEFEKIREIWRDSMANQALVDYDNDGKKNILLEILYSNSSIGLDFNYFDELTENQKEFTKTKLRDLLQKMQGRGVRRPTSTYSNKFFIFDGKTYYEYNTRDEHQISIIEDETIKVLCTQKTIVKTKVK